MLRECRWNLVSTLPVAEIVERIGNLIARRTDFTRNLHAPPELMKQLDESGTAFSAAGLRNLIKKSPPDVA